MQNVVSYMHSSQVNMKHDVNGCQCDKLAHDDVTALLLIKQTDPIPCSNDLFEFVWQVTHLILSHRESHSYQYLPWFDLLTTELWQLAKQLKEQSLECDLPVLLERSAEEEEVVVVDEESYRRAIRITIYNCRALVSEQLNDIQQAIRYYQKCVSVRPTPFESQQHIQFTALKALTHLSNTFFIDTSTSSISSDASLVTCTYCGIEKSYMPVCSQCKSQPYCSIRCMKSHCSIHNQTCKKRINQ